MRALCLTWRANALTRKTRCSFTSDSNVRRRMKILQLNDTQPEWAPNAHTRAFTVWIDMGYIGFTSTAMISDSLKKTHWSCSWFLRWRAECCMSSWHYVFVVVWLIFTVARSPNIFFKKGQMMRWWWENANMRFNHWFNTLLYYCTLHNGSLTVTQASQVH